jgi:hypothetical protein
MYCPACGVEYRDGFSRCNDCDVALVAGPPPATVRVDERPDALLWQGVDPQALANIRSILSEANIRYSAHQPDTPIFFTSTPRAWEIRVFVDDLDRAAKLIADQVESDDDLDASVADALENETEETEEESVADDAEDSSPSNRDYVPDDWDPEQATCEVWSGDDRAIAKNLCDCLRENGVGSRVPPEVMSLRIFVLPGDEARAREIVREVIEQAPPA